MRSNLFSTELEVRESLAGRSASPTSPTGFVTEQIKIAVRAGCHMVVRLSPLSSLGHQRCSSLLPPYKSPPCCEAAQCACLAHRAAGLQVVILLDVDFRPSLELSDMVYNQSKYQSLLSVVNNKFAVILPAMEAFGERDVSNLHATSAILGEDYLYDTMADAVDHLLSRQHSKVTHAVPVVFEISWNSCIPVLASVIAAVLAHLLPLFPPSCVPGGVLPACTANPALHPASEQQSTLASLSALQHAQCCSRCCHDAILMLLSLCLADPTTLPACVQREWLCSRAGL